MAAPAFSIVEEAKKLKLKPVESPANDTGYAGVGSVGKRYQARFKDEVRNKMRAVPGLYDYAYDAALARAYALHKQAEAKAEGLEIFPETAKRKKRGSAAAAAPASLPVAMAMPIAAPSPVPFAALQPLGGGVPVAMAMPMATEAPAAGYTAPHPQEVADSA